MTKVIININEWPHGLCFFELKNNKLGKVTFGKSEFDVLKKSHKTCAYILIWPENKSERWYMLLPKTKKRHEQYDLVTQYLTYQQINVDDYFLQIYTLESEEQNLYLYQVYGIKKETVKQTITDLGIGKRRVNVIPEAIYIGRYFQSSMQENMLYCLDDDFYIRRNVDHYIILAKDWKDSILQDSEKNAFMLDRSLNTIWKESRDIANKQVILNSESPETISFAAEDFCINSSFVCEKFKDLYHIDAKYKYMILIAILIPAILLPPLNYYEGKLLANLNTEMKVGSKWTSPSENTVSENIKYYKLFKDIEACLANDITLKSRELEGSEIMLKGSTQSLDTFLEFLNNLEKNVRRNVVVHSLHKEINKEGWTFILAIQLEGDR